MFRHTIQQKLKTKYPVLIFFRKMKSLWKLFAHKHALSTWSIFCRKWQWYPRENDSLSFHVNNFRQFPFSDVKTFSTFFFCGKQIQTKEENSHFLQSQIKRQTYFTVPPNQRSKIQNTIENEITIDKMHQNGNLWKCLKLKITFLTDIQSAESKCNRVLSNCSWNNLSLFHIHHIKWSSPFSYLYYLTVCVSFQRGAEDREEE